MNSSGNVNMSGIKCINAKTFIINAPNVSNRKKNGKRFFIAFTPL